jgi:hypothetical protein
MNDVDYVSVLNDAFEKFTAFVAQRQTLEIEIAKLKQFMNATVNMLPDAERAAFNEKLDRLVKENEVYTAPLTEAIKNVLRNAGRNWLTVAQVRDRLLSSGFDFTGYTANPLASISTTMSRMKPSQVESTSIEGVRAYRWLFRFPRGKKSRSAKFEGKYGPESNKWNPKN